MSISFTEPNLAYVDRVVASGEFSSRSEFINHVIRETRADMAREAEIKAAIEEGERSGLDPRSFEDIEAEVLARMKRDAA